MSTVSDRDAPHSVWQYNAGTGGWDLVESGLTRRAADQYVAEHNVGRLGRIFVFLPDGREPGPEHMPSLNPRPPRITREEAAHVLHHYGEGGMEAGSFIRQLIAAMVAADPVNLARLATVFPGYAAAVRLANGSLDGITTLQALARL